MRYSRRSGRFLLVFLLNLLLNLEWSIPAWIFLGLHFLFDFCIWWFVGALMLWITGILVGMRLMNWAAGCGSEKDIPKENKNPYSNHAKYQLK